MKLNKFQTKTRQISITFYSTVFSSHCTTLLALSANIPNVIIQFQITLIGIKFYMKKSDVTLTFHFYKKFKESIPDHQSLYFPVVVVWKGPADCQVSPSDRAGLEIQITNRQKQRESLL